MKKLILIIINFFCISCSYAYSNLDSLQAIQDKTKAFSLLENGQLDSAIFYEKKTTEYYFSQDDLISWINFYRGKGWKLRAQNNYKDCLNAFQFGIKQKWRAPKNTKEFQLLALLFIDIGYTYGRLNDHKSKIENYEVAKSIYLDSIKIENCSHVGRYIYSELGNSYNRIRDYEKAAFYLLRRKQICTQDKDWESVVETCYDLGIVYFNQDKFSKAANTYQEGLSYSQINLESKIILLNELAKAYHGKGDYEKMFSYIQKCKSIVDKSGYSKEEKENSLFNIYVNSGNYHKAIKEFGKAEVNYNMARELLNKDDILDKKWITFTHIYKGDLYYQWGKYKLGLQEYHNALTNFLPNFDNPDLYTSPSKEQLIKEPNLMPTFSGKAKCFMALYEEKKNSSFSQLALKNLELAKEVDELILQDYVLSGSKLTALSMNREIKNDIIKINYNLWKENPTLKTAEAIFSTSEQSRALLLMEGVSFSKLVGENQTNELRQSIEELTHQIDALKKEIFDLPKDNSQTTQDKSFNLQKELIQVQEEKKELLAKLEERNPGVKLSQDKLISISEVQQSLQKEQAFVEYFIFDTTGYIIMISPDDFFIKKIKWNEDWSQKARELKNQIFNQNNKTYIQNATSLFQHLIQPIEQFTDAKNLIIVPDGELWNIPFDALLTKNVSKDDYNNFKTLPYLIHEKNISYAFSATLQSQMNKAKASRNSKNKFYALAPSYHKIADKNFSPIALRNNLDTLIFNQPEVKDISSLTNAIPLSGSDASKENFLNILSQANVLHIAAHAKANLLEPDLSFIAFSNTGDTLTHPFRLYTYEMYNQPMSMELVVLSACETATGLVSEGEGVINIARTFAHGGTQSIVTTLWSIPDNETTKDIIVNFYKGLKEKNQKDVSLRNAKLAHISKSDHVRAHPKYWAAFTAVGNMNPIALDTFSWMPYLLGGLGVMIFLGVIFLRRG